MTNDVTTRWHHTLNGSNSTADEGSETSETGGSPPESGSETAAFRRWCAETRATLAEAEHARIVVYLRSMLPPPGAKDAQMDALNDLRSLTDTTPVEDVTVNVWGERLCLCDRCRETDTGRRMINAVRTFEGWGMEYEASAESFFEQTRQQSSIVGDAHEGITPPRVTAALYVDGSIQGVFPARFDDECYSVHDFADAIDRESDTERPPEPVESTP